MHRKLAAASCRVRRSDSAPQGGMSAMVGAARISAARPPSANSRLPIPQRMGGQVLKRPRSAGHLGRQPWPQETTGEKKDIYGTQWAQERDHRCDFCGKRANKPRVLPAGKMDQDDNPV